MAMRLRDRLPSGIALTVLFVGFSTGDCRAFTFERRVGGIPVTDGSFLIEPFTGGLNSPRPNLADLNADLDLDLLITQPDGGITYYRNDGTPTDFLYHFATDNLQGIDANTWCTLADIDADGDLDLFTDGNGSVVFYRNIGGPTSPNWQLVTSTFQGITNSGFGNTPQFTDVDRDGDLDYLEMEQNQGKARFYRNQGTAQNPNFVFVTDTFGCIDTFDPGGLGRAANGEERHGISVISTADIDADMDADIFIGDLTNPNLWFFRNDPVASCNPACTPSNSCYHRATRDFLPISTQGINQARFGDLDHDGDLDLLVGSTESSAVLDNLIYFINTGTPQSPILQPVDMNFIKAIDIGRGSQPATGDLDGDNDLDLFIGGDDGLIIPYWNTGTRTSPNLMRGPALKDNLNVTIDVGSGAAPVWIDYEGDGDLDLIVGTGQSPARLRFYRNDGTAAAMSLRLVNSQFGNVSADFNAAPAVGDLDDDGDLDLLVGEFGVTGNPRLFYVRNDGTSQNPVWVTVCDDRPATCVFAERVFTGDISPELYDLDHDGDLDLLLGERDGNVNFYRNAGSPQVFNFVLESQAFAGAQVGFESAPEVADITGDGFEDLFCGEANGGLDYYRQVPPIGIEEPAPAPEARPLLQVRPNPTRGGVIATFELSAPGRARAALYTLDGRLIRLLADRELGAGRHPLVWDGRDDHGRRLPAGTYLLRVEHSGKTLVAKVTIVH